MAATGEVKVDDHNKNMNDEDVKGRLTLEGTQGGESKPDDAKTASNNGNAVPLYDASKMGFNDRAWNDPPPLLMSVSGEGQIATSGGQFGRRSKLTTRIPFPINSSGPQCSAPAVNLNPNAPPPTSGFVNMLPPGVPKEQSS